MTRLWILAAVAVAALCVTSAALAKGASQATISGPGLKKGGIVLKSDKGGDPTSGSKLGALAERTGFFPAVFGQAPDPMLRERPQGTRLGPRYTAEFVMPGPNNESSIIRQDLYPFAKPYVLSYTKPGQRFWNGQLTRGGWFQAPVAMRTVLVSAGLPNQPPGASSGDGSDWLRWVAIAITAAAGLALLAVVTLVALRRRLGPATA
jgi:hypothetical protein